MDYLIFVANVTDSISTESLCSLLQDIQGKCQSDRGVTTCVGKVVSTSSDLTIAEVVHDNWIPVSDIDVESLKQTKPGSNEDKGNGSTENRSCLGRTLLDVSQSLPYAGVSVHVVLFNLSLGCDSEDGESPYLPLYGALKKLSSWHNAEITVVTDTDISPSVQELVDFTGASVTANTSSVFPAKQSHCVWRGKISVMNKMENDGHIFPGFALCCDDEDDVAALFNRTRRLFNRSTKSADADIPMFGRMLEVLDQVDSRTVPPFMLTQHSLQLSTWKRHPFSEVLLQELLEDTQTAVLGRLAVYSTDQVQDCSQKLSAQAWRDSLMTNIDYVQDREEDHGSGVRFMNLLLLRDESGDFIKVIVLHDASEINSRLFSLESTICAGNHGDRTNGTMEEYLGSLGHMSGEILQEINRSLRELQTQMLTDWIVECEKREETPVMSAEMLWRMLGNIQNEFLHTLASDGIFSMGEKQDERDPLPVLPSDLACDPVQWPERQALHHHDNQKREMRRFQSSDSMCLSSPLHPDEANTSVDVKDFLKLFKPDGNASKDSLSPIRQQSKRKLTKLSSQGDITLQWPECKNTHYHGIDYYKHQVSEKKEKHFSQLREKYLKEETCSSFTTKTLLKKKSTASHHRRQRSGGHSILSPNRRSPRGIRGNQAHRKEEEDLRPLSSQPSRQKLLMQHPGLKSPRKRQSLPSQQLRRSPRKQPSATFQRLRSDGDITLPPPPKRKRRSDPEPLNDSLDEKSLTQADASAASDAVKKPSRSERHKKKLEEICRSVLVKHGVAESDIIFKSCADKLFQVTKFFVKALPNSRNLSQEMKNIAEGQVTQVVDLEKRRQEMKKSSKK